MLSPHNHGGKLESLALNARSKLGKAVAGELNVIVWYKLNDALSSAHLGETRLGRKWRLQS